MVSGISKANPNAQMEVVLWTVLVYDNKGQSIAANEVSYGKNKNIASGMKKVKNMLLQNQITGGCRNMPDGITEIVQNKVRAGAI